ncbi:MAG: HlyD family type I secretion periplasmic adaptor subunit [Pseudomonadota bacterium]
MTSDDVLPGDGRQIKEEPVRPATPSGVPTAISADLLRPPGRGLDVLVIALVALVFAFIAWSAFAVIEEVTRGEGRIVPASKIQIVQNLEGGIVEELKVQEGDQVSAGAVLLRIDPTQATSNHGEARQRIFGLRVLIARLRAEIESVELSFAPEISQAASSLVAREREHFVERKTELNAALSVLTSQAKQRSQEIKELKAKIGRLGQAAKLAKEELAILKPLAARRAVSRTKLIDAERKLNDTLGSLEAAELAVPRIEAQLQEVQQRRKEKRSAFRADALKQLTQARVELAALQQSSRGQADTLARTTVRAPVNGIVKTVSVTTIGQVIKPGSDLVEIVPINDTLLVEARVRPSDIAFLRPGQPALVKLTAYDFALYGGLDGRLERIGADSVTNDKGESYYVITVRTTTNKLTHGGADLPIIPGMVVQVDIKTGRKTVLTYLTKPLTRVRQEALRER